MKKQAIHKKEKDIFYTKNIIKKRTTSGITLIALVITIIVLLLLAGISINVLTGENGVITKAKIAKEETEKSRI